MNCKRKRSTKTKKTVLEIDYLDKINELGAAEFEVMQYEKAASISIYKSKNKKKEVIDFNTANEDKAMPYFKQETLISSNERKDLMIKLY
jgi:amidase